MPPTADVLRLVRLLHHQRDLRIAFGMGEEPVDVDLRELARQPDVLPRRQPLVAEEDDAMVRQRAADRIQGVAGQGLRQVYAADLGPDSGASRPDHDRIAQHGECSSCSLALTTPLRVCRYYKCTICRA